MGADFAERLARKMLDELRRQAEAYGREWVEEMVGTDLPADDPVRPMLLGAFQAGYLTALRHHAGSISMLRREG